MQSVEEDAKFARELHERVRREFPEVFQMSPCLGVPGFDLCDFAVANLQVLG